jgi:ABC-type branched-subunit amino acid transport system substrate-binding protein
MCIMVTSRLITLIFKLTLLLFLATTIATAEIHNIGVILDLSGPASYLGQQYRMGAELAAKDLRREEIYVRLFFGDHSLNSTKAVTEIQKMISLNQVEAVFINGTAASVAASEVARTHRRLFIYSAAALSPVRTNSSAFKTFTNFQTGCRELAKHWRTAGIKQIGILKATHEFGDICLRGAVEIYPDVIEQAYQPGEDVSSQILSFKQRGVQAVMNPSYEADFLNMLKNISDFRYKVQIGGYVDALTEKVKRSYSDLLQRVNTFGLPPVSASFIEKIKTRYPQTDFEVWEGTALCYTHIMQLGRVLNRCKKGNLDCQIKILSNSPPDNIIGFKGWKNRVADFDLVVKDWDSRKIK